jgi:hypothetical protein
MKKLCHKQKEIALAFEKTVGLLKIPHKRKLAIGMLLFNAR